MPNAGRTVRIHGPLRKECHVPSAPMTMRQWRIFAGRSHVLGGGGRHEAEQLDLLAGAQLVERHLGEIRPHVEAVVLQVGSQRQHHVARVQDLGQHRQDLPALAVAGDLLPMRDGIAHRGAAEIGLELVELPGMPQLLDPAGPDGAQDGLAHVLDGRRQSLGAIADLRSGRGCRLLLFCAAGLRLGSLR